MDGSIQRWKSCVEVKRRAVDEMVLRIKSEPLILQRSTVEISQEEIKKRGHFIEKWQKYKEIRLKTFVGGNMVKNGNWGFVVIVGRWMRSDREINGGDCTLKNLLEKAEGNGVMRN